MRNKKLIVNLLNIGGIGILIGGIIIIAPGKWKEDLQKEDVENTFKVNDNHLEYERKKAETILSVPVETIKQTPGTEAKVIKVESKKVRVPSGPTCGDLANAVQQSYANSYNQGKTPVRVQFYGTDNYYSVPLKLVENGEYNEIVNIYTRYVERGDTYTRLPESINCHMKNASYVEYGPTGNKYCPDIVVKFSFDRNSFGYGEMNRRYCKASR